MLKEPPKTTLLLMKFVINYLPLIDQIIPVLFIGSGLVLWAVALRGNSRSLVEKEKSTKS